MTKPVVVMGGRHIGRRAIPCDARLLVGAAAAAAGKGRVDDVLDEEADEEKQAASGLSGLVDWAHYLHELEQPEPTWVDVGPLFEDEGEEAFYDVTYDLLEEDIETGRLTNSSAELLGLPTDDQKPRKEDFKVEEDVAAAAEWVYYVNEGMRIPDIWRCGPLSFAGSDDEESSNDDPFTPVSSPLRSFPTRKVPYMNLNRMPRDTKKGKDTRRARKLMSTSSFGIPRRPQPRRSAPKQQGSKRRGKVRQAEASWTRGTK